MKLISKIQGIWLKFDLKLNLWPSMKIVWTLDTSFLLVPVVWQRARHNAVLIKCAALFNFSYFEHLTTAVFPQLSLFSFCIHPCAVLLSTVEPCWLFCLNTGTVAEGSRGFRPLMRLLWLVTQSTILFTFVVSQCLYCLSLEDWSAPVNH